MITYIPKADEFFKPLYDNYGGNFKVKESKIHSTHSALCVISKLARRCCPRGDFQHIWTPLVGIFQWLIVQGLQEAFRFSSVWHAVGGYLCIKARPVPPQWKIPFSTSISDLLCVIVSGYFTWQWHKVRNTVVCFVLSYRVSTITFSIIFFYFPP